ncbi:MAG TPA: hypothetical protein VKA08_05030 [Balneolales bacterium]|nr:hypothetical protein [Balneolales bacterium]
MKLKTIYAESVKSLQNAGGHWLIILKAPWAKAILKWSRIIFVAAILCYMIVHFFEIGLGNIWNNLPVKPLFYILYLPLFFLLPLSEVFIYKIIWPVSYRKLFTALLVKKVYNSEVLGYSGEVFLFWWVRKEIGGNSTDIMRLIKDNNVLSAIVSTLFTIIILFIFFETNPTVFNSWVQKIADSQLYFLIISAGIVAALVIKFKKYIISLSLLSSLEIFAIHFLRHVLLVVIQIYQWHIILPEISLHIWFTFVVAQIVLAILPFVPNKDLLFISISISMSTMLQAPLAAVTAILLVNSVMDRTLHLVIYSYYQFFTQKKKILTDLQPESPELLQKAAIPTDIETLPLKS